MTRRRLILGVAGAAVQPLRAQPTQPFRVGIVPAGPGRTGPVAAFWSNCDQVSSLGFHFTEFNNTRAQVVEAYASRVSEFRDEMAKRHLTLAGVALFSRIADPLQRDELIAHHMLLGRFLSAVGGNYITHMIAPGEVLNEPADANEYKSVDLKVWAAHANEIGARLANEHGVSLAYHPEQGEIRTGLYERILDRTDERYFRLLVDTGHIASGGADPVAICAHYRTRLACVHLKDFAPAAEPVKAGNVPFGKGNVDLRTLVHVLRETQFAGWIMAETGGTNEQTHDYMVEDLGLAI